MLIIKKLVKDRNVDLLQSELSVALRENIVKILNKACQNM